MSVAGRGQGKVAWPVTRRFCNDVVVDPIYRPGVIPDPAELSDGQVLLRTWSQDDLGCIEAASRDPVIPGGTTVPSLFSEEAGRAFVARQWGRSTSGEGLSLAITEAETGIAVGLMVLLHRQQPGVVGVGYWMLASRRRRGFTRRALSLLSPWALGLPAVTRLEALVEPLNIGSVRVLEGAGFRREGLLRAYLDLDTGRADALLYSRLRDDTEDAAG